ncbi:DUF6584 family protein [Streptomyces sp. NPDC059651]|uniref:DUF6584 family protein n=1 Tax=Streptomyces sp. NPDC059651 TaxID=3346897 RepID=UPI0036BD097B
MSSRAGTTCTDCTAAPATSVPPSTKPHSQPDHHTNGVRQSGTSSLEEDRNADETAAFEARYRSPGWRMKALAWHGPEAKAATAFSARQLVAVRAACATKLERPVDWDDPTSYRDDLEGKYEAPSKPWPVGSVLAGFCCIVPALVFLAI